MASLAEETVTFKQFYYFVRSITCPNTLKMWMICKKLKLQRVGCEMEKAIFKTIYQDFFSINAPYCIAVGDFTREALKIYIELANPIKIKHLLLLIQKELHETLSQEGSFDFYFIYLLVEDLFHA